MSINVEEIAAHVLTEAETEFDTGEALDTLAWSVDDWSMGDLIREIVRAHKKTESENIVAQKTWVKEDLETTWKVFTSKDHPSLEGHTDEVIEVALGLDYSKLEDCTGTEWASIENNLQIAAKIVEDQLM